MGSNSSQEGDEQFAAVDQDDQGQATGELGWWGLAGWLVGWSLIITSNTELDECLEAHNLSFNKLRCATYDELDPILQGICPQDANQRERLRQEFLQRQRELGTLPRLHIRYVLESDHEDDGKLEEVCGLSH